MTAHATEPNAAPAPASPAGPAAREFVVTVRDDVDARIAGRVGGAYSSPPQPHADALALIGLLLGGPAADDGSERWTWPVPGGRRTVTLTPACRSLPGPAVPHAGGTQSVSEAQAARPRTKQIATRSEP
jgi:hypothetical protein